VAGPQGCQFSYALAEGIVFQRVALSCNEVRQNGLLFLGHDNTGIKLGIEGWNTFCCDNISGCTHNLVGREER